MGEAENGYAAVLLVDFEQNVLKLVSGQCTVGEGERSFPRGEVPVAAQRKNEAETVYAGLSELEAVGTRLLRRFCDKGGVAFDVEVVADAFNELGKAFGLFVCEHRVDFVIKLEHLV